MSPYPRLRRSAAALLTAALAGVAVPGPAAVAEEAAPGAVVTGTPATQVPGDGVYVVTLVGRPAASYSGSVPGLAATRPAAGERFDRTRPEVAAYRQRLLGQQDRVLDAIGRAEVLYRYTTAVNGFAARLDAGQVKQLRVTPGVALVERSVTRPVDMTDTADALGVDAMWKVAGGPDKAGRGQVIGVVDTGIWPENPSFAGLPQDIPGTAARVPGFHGACTRGESWDPGVCSSKLVSARYFVKGFGAGNLSRAEYLSPRDGTGHGSHTAAVAAGNDDVRVRIEGQDFGETTGIAPGARIAAYKACWAAPDPDDDGCTTADTVAAVDAAVADGVDVLNYSVSGPGDTVTDSVELAFLHATAAGVFVAASAGNRGPGASTVGHASPWVTTVGASTHQRLQGAVALGDGNALVGAMAADRRVPETGIVLGSEAAAPGASTDEARLCELGALDAREVQDNIVVCDRGTTARVDKSVAVAAGRWRRHGPGQRRTRHGRRRRPLRAHRPPRRGRRGRGPRLRPRHRGPHRLDRPVGHRRHPGAADRRLLLPRPVGRRRGRPAQARPDRPRGQRARRGGAAVELGPPVGPHLGHVDERARTSPVSPPWSRPSGRTGPPPRPSRR